MRIAFLLAVLAGGTYYTYVAFADLNFLTRTGRLGPGFFPRSIGVMIVLLTIWALSDALRQGRGDQADAGRWRDVVMLMALAVCYAVTLRVFGGFLATVIYLAVTLAVLNRGRPVQNALLSVIVPVVIYLLFDRVLNASMPPGLVDILPI
ncbi:tripartite tricarboxylate transporter TctB family protein [Puniceibacterium confluentis]|uniref:tripartite tricarboxylate transporter TctB family protein n=1 Tax=Puniceibacterium confluentis TaxID=1958944 RepID=UPI0011B46D0E|nr:tripartite tricarboxylate transporter TctB family protein [Puniceibacterium confluentis]